MKSSIVTFAMYAAIFLLVGAILYFFVFWRPHSNRVDQLNRDIATAHTELLTVSQMEEALRPQWQYDIERLEQELSQAQSDYAHISHNWYYGYLRFLPEVFNDADIESRIDRIVTPYAHNLQIFFQYSQPLSVMNYSNNPSGLPEGIWLTPIYIEFITDYHRFISILNGFAREGIDNRIVEYSLNQYGHDWNITIRLDILTRTPAPYRHNGNYVVDGYGR